MAAANKVSLALFLALHLFCLLPAICWAAAQVNRPEPLFLDEEFDTHTTSVSGQSQSVSAKPATTRLLGPRQQVTSKRDSIYLGDNRASVLDLIKSPSSNVGTNSASDKIPQFTFAPTAPAITITRATHLPLFGNNSAKRSAATEAPHHWSALENYYNRLSNIYPQDSGRNTNDQRPQQVIYVYQRERDDSIPVAVRYVPENLPYVTGDAKNTAFLLPMLDIGSRQSSEKDGGYSVYHQSAPGVSRSPIQAVVVDPRYSDIVQQQTELNSGHYNVGYIPIYTTGQQQQQQQQQLQYQRPYVQALSSDSKRGKSADYHVNEKNGLVEYLEWQRLQDLLNIRQQQERAKHQQELLGISTYGRLRAVNDEEVGSCGPRNYVNYTWPSSLTDDMKAASPYQLAGVDQNNQHIPVTLSAGEFPSHLGIFNGSKPADDNFLCAGTWLSERFALTLASCVTRAKANMLKIRLGEWNYNKSDANNVRPMVSVGVKQIHVFPKFGGKLTEHNIALLEFDEPIRYYDHPYIYPACHVRDRNHLRSSSCWAPIRNVTKVEYFDAEGEGETKEKKLIRMSELPIKLLVNDDECQRLTKVEAFNFKNPNLICTNDVINTGQQKRLDQAEYQGSGVYCNDRGNLGLVAILHPINSNTSSSPPYGYQDISYYRDWIRSVIYG